MEAPDNWRSRYRDRVRQYLDGELTADQFRLHLFSLGYRHSEIDREVEKVDSQRISDGS